MSRAGNEARRRDAILRALPATLWPGEWRLHAEGGGSYMLLHSSGPAEEMRVGEEVTSAYRALFVADEVPLSSFVTAVGRVDVRPGHGGLSEACRAAYGLGLSWLVCEL